MYPQFPLRSSCASSDFFLAARDALASLSDIRLLLRGPGTNLGPSLARLTGLRRCDLSGCHAMEVDEVRTRYLKISWPEMCASNRLIPTDPKESL